MKSLTTTEIISFENRLQRSRGRTGRTHSANVKLTKDELEQLETIAQSEKKALGEWAREVLLRDAKVMTQNSVLVHLPGRGIHQQIVLRGSGRDLAKELRAYPSMGGRHGVRRLRRTPGM